MIKFAFISSHPAPYRDELLGRLVKISEIETTVYTEWTFDKFHTYWNLENPPYEINQFAPPKDSKIRILWRVLGTFVFGPYDCVCWNGFPPRLYMMFPLMLSAILGKKYGIYADSVIERHGRGLLHWLKSFIIKRAAFFFVPGNASIKFFSENYGVPLDRFCKGAYALDGCKIEADIRSRRVNRDAIRLRQGIKPDDKVFLMVANMMPKRQYPLTTRAFLEATENRSDVRYVIVGKGEDLPTMEALSKKKPQIIVIPGCSFDEMKDLYAMADVYVHGGAEPASTALVIGALAHLPLMSSKAVGCTYDCIQDDVSGIEIKHAESEAEWSIAFKDMLNRKDDWGKMGDAAREFSRSLDVDVCLPALVTMVKNTCGKK